MCRYANEYALCSFGAVWKDHTKLVYNDAAILLTMAIADNFLFAVQPVKEALETPPGEDELRLCRGSGRQSHITEMHQGRYLS
jgi:hypothetical protein